MARVPRAHLAAVNQIVLPREPGYRRLHPHSTRSAVRGRPHVPRGRRRLVTLVTCCGRASGEDLRARRAAISEGCMMDVRSRPNSDPASDRRPDRRPVRSASRWPAGDAIRVDKLDAAVESGWRELRTADDDGDPWASGVEVAIVAEELARGRRRRVPRTDAARPSFGDRWARPPTRARDGRVPDRPVGPRRARRACGRRRRRGRDLGARARPVAVVTPSVSVRVRGVTPAST